MGCHDQWREGSQKRAHVAGVSSPAAPPPYMVVGDFVTPPSAIISVLGGGGGGMASAMAPIDLNLLPAYSLAWTTHVGVLLERHLEEERESKTARIIEMWSTTYKAEDFHNIFSPHLANRVP
ncbi:conserved hypothetical protein [Ricinus communis]|uniref:Uncharacterized protein n=1 Tax=Ricinus communis TaxID=3988 RepID=B9RVG1_RICCO|nr:conserved hypothetical protein [Ricinus communis]